MNKVLRGNKSLFVERWAKAESINAVLVVALVVMSGVTIMMVVAMSYMALKPRPIYYIPAPLEAGVAFPHKELETSVLLFSASWILNFTNFTPATVEDVFKRAQKQMSPAYLSRSRDKLRSDASQIRLSNVSSLFTLQADPVLEKASKGYRVNLRGRKAMFAGREPIENQAVSYSVSVRRVSPTELNPHGLVIDDLTQANLGGA